MTDICKLDWDVDIVPLVGVNTPYDLLNESKDTDSAVHRWYGQLMGCSDEEYGKMMRLALHALEALEAVNSYVDELVDKKAEVDNKEGGVMLNSIRSNGMNWFVTRLGESEELVDWLAMDGVEIDPSDSHEEMLVQIALLENNRNLEVGYTYKGREE